MPINSMLDLGAEEVTRKPDQIGSMADLGAQEITKGNEEVARAASLLSASPAEQRKIHEGNLTAGAKAEREAGTLPVLGQYMAGRAKATFKTGPEIALETAGAGSEALGKTLAPKSWEDMLALNKYLTDMIVGIPEFAKGLYSQLTTGTPQEVGEASVLAEGLARGAVEPAAPIARAGLRTGVSAARTALEHPETTGRIAGAAVGEEIGRHTAGPTGALIGGSLGERLGGVAGKILGKPEVKQKLSRVLDWLDPEKKEALVRAYSSPAPTPEVVETKLSDVADAIRGEEIPAARAEDIYTQAGLSPAEIERQRLETLKAERKGLKRTEGVHPQFTEEEGLQFKELMRTLRDEEAKIPYKSKGKLVDVDSPEFAEKVSKEGGAIIKKRPGYVLMFLDQEMGEKVNAAVGTKNATGLTLFPTTDPVTGVVSDTPASEGPIRKLNNANLFPKFDESVPIVTVKVGKLGRFVTPSSQSFVPYPRVSETFRHERGGHLSRFEAMQEAKSDNPYRTNWLNRDEFQQAYGDEAAALLHQAERTKYGYPAGVSVEEVFNDIAGGRADLVDLTKNEGAQLLIYLTDYIANKYGEPVAAKMMKESAPSLRGSPVSWVQKGLPKQMSRETLGGIFPRRPVKEAAGPVISLINKNGGVTLDPSSLQPRSYDNGFQVSIEGHEYPLAKALATERSEQTLRHFKLAATENKGDIGAWVEGDNIVWDVSRHHETLEDAVKAAEKNKQRAIWDWKNKRSIPIDEARKILNDPALAQRYETEGMFPVAGEGEKGFGATPEEQAMPAGSEKVYGFATGEKPKGVSPEEFRKQMREQFKTEPKFKPKSAPGTAVPPDLPMFEYYRKERPGSPLKSEFPGISKQDVIDNWESQIPFARKERYMLKSEEGRITGRGMQETGTHPSNIEGLNQVPGSVADIERAFKTKKGPVWNAIEKAAQEQADTWSPALLESKETPGGMKEAKEPTWYETANARMKQIAKDAKLPVKTVAGVAAALSPNNSWSNNVADVKKWIAAHTMGELKPNTPAGTYPKNREKAYQIMQGADPGKVLKGPKVRAFYKALLGKGTDPVIDFHMANILTGGETGTTAAEAKNLSPYEYQQLAERLKQQAAEAGMSPADYQAMLWTKHRAGAQRSLFPEKGGTK